MERKFKMILEEIAKNNKITKTQIAKDLGISNTMITYLFQGKRELSVKLIKRIKDKYKVSYDTIIGN
jgi:transcriptional regulator with XRE-family HTH domain